MAELFSEEKLKKEIEGTIDYFQKSLKQVRTGKADVLAINEVKVEAYGAQSALNTVGQVIAEDAVNVKINVWDKNVLPNVEAALRNSTLGASVAIDGESIRLKFNPITEEDRKNTSKQISDMLEETRIKIRHSRHKFMEELKKLEGVSEDVQKRDMNELQEIIDSSIKSAEEIAKKKQDDIMRI